MIGCLIGCRKTDVVLFATYVLSVIMYEMLLLQCILLNRHGGNLWRHFKEVIVDRFELHR